MKYAALYRCCIVLSLMGSAGGALAQGGQTAGVSGDARSALVQPLYVPPMRGVPQRLVAGASRGAEHKDKNLRFASLAPEHVGLVGEPSPTLFWYSNKVVPEAVIFTLRDATSDKPLLQRELPRMAKTGPQPIAFQELGIQLEPGKVYEWSITVLRGGEDRSKDWVCGGAVFYRADAPVPGDTIQAIRSLAAQGRWYEALAHSEQGLGESSLLSAQRKQLLSYRHQLLQDIGLQDVAERLVVD